MHHEGRFGSRFPLGEFLWVSISFILAAMGWTALQGGAVTWDAFNHHIYLGRQALEGSRLQHDYFAVGGMSCQYPLGYAPLVAMLDAGWPGMGIFQVLTLLAALCGPACWLITWCVMPSPDRAARWLRLAGTFLALTGVLWWKVLAQTSNDAIGMSLAIWSVALAMLCVGGPWWASRARLRMVICGMAGMLAGLGFVIKLTQFIAIIAAFSILLFINARWSERLKCVICFGMAATAVTLAVGTSWGYDSWRACGSPIYPFMLDYFQSVAPGDKQ